MLCGASSLATAGFAPTLDRVERKGAAVGRQGPTEMVWVFRCDPSQQRDPAQMRAFGRHARVVGEGQRACAGRRGCGRPTWKAPWPICPSRPAPRPTPAGVRSRRLKRDAHALAAAIRGNAQARRLSIRNPRHPRRVHCRTVRQALAVPIPQPPMQNVGSPSVLRPPALTHRRDPPRGCRRARASAIDGAKDLETASESEGDLLGGVRARTWAMPWRVDGDRCADGEGGPRRSAQLLVDLGRVARSRSAGSAWPYAGYRRISLTGCGRGADGTCSTGRVDGAGTRPDASVVASRSYPPRVRGPARPLLRCQCDHAKGRRLP